MKTLSLLVALAFLTGCSKPVDPSGVYVIGDRWSVTRYDIQSSGASKISGSASFAGVSTSWHTQGTWKMENGTLILSAPKPENLDPSGKVTDYKFTIEPNGDLITLECEEFPAGLRAVKQ
jgi:hypothetical protein